MDLETYRDYEDAYGFEGLNTSKGEEMVEELEPVVTYELDGEELRIYDNRPTGWKRIFQEVFSEPGFVVGMDVDIGGEEREMYLAGDLDAWSDMDSDILGYAGTGEVKKFIQRPFS